MWWEVGKARHALCPKFAFFVLTPVMTGEEGLELRGHILAGSFWKKGGVVGGHRAVLVSGVNISYPAGLQCLGNVSASQMAERA